MNLFRISKYTSKSTLSSTFPPNVFPPEACHPANTPHRCQAGTDVMVTSKRVVSKKVFHAAIHFHATIHGHAKIHVPCSNSCSMQQFMFHATIHVSCNNSCSMKQFMAMQKFMFHAAIYVACGNSYICLMQPISRLECYNRIEAHHSMQQIIIHQRFNTTLKSNQKIIFNTPSRFLICSVIIATVRISFNNRTTSLLTTQNKYEY